MTSKSQGPARQNFSGGGAFTERGQIMVDPNQPIFVFWHNAFLKLRAEQPDAKLPLEAIMEEQTDTYLDKAWNSLTPTQQAELSKMIHATVLRELRRDDLGPQIRRMLQESVKDVVAEELGKRLDELHDRVSKGITAAWAEAVEAEVKRQVEGALADVRKRFASKL